jgi:hypothetical protein
VDGLEYDAAPGETLDDRDRDRRDRQRVTVAVPFSMYAGRRLLLRARTLDLSTAGALLHGTCGVQVGEPVSLEVARGPARNPLRLQAEVVRFSEPDVHRRHTGVAVRFVNLSAVDEAVLRTIIDAAQG